MGGKRRRGDGCARSRSDLEALRAAVRGGGVLPRAELGGGATRRGDPGRVRVGAERTRAACLGPPLAGRPAARRRGQGARRPLGRRARHKAPAERARPAGAQDLRQPGNGGARRRNAARGDPVPRQPRPAHAAAEPACAPARAQRG